MSFLKDNGLSIILLGATVASIVPMSVVGFMVSNQEAALHGAAGSSFLHYLSSGHFLSALFENWESEFLQMSAYVCLTAYFYQRGSAESKDPDAPEDGEEDPEGGMSFWLARTAYAYSLGIVLGLMFLSTLILHLIFSAQAAAEDATRHGAQASTIVAHLLDAQFWFESFQNWQSEFLSTLVLVLLSVFLRYRGSPESKRVDAPNSQTGTD